MQSDPSWKDSRAFHCEMIVEQFYLYVRSEDGIIPVCHRIHN